MENIDLGQKKKIVNIGVFLDGRPGHEKQTIGILQQLQKKILVNINRIRVKKKTLMQQAFDWAQFFIGSRSNCSSNESNYDLLIGTGTHTHLPMLMLKKECNIPVISCMTPSPLLLRYFDLLFVPHHDDTAPRDNIFLTTGPPNCNEDLGSHKPAKVLILIGGTDPKSHKWDSEKIVEQIGKLITFDPEKNYFISSSPRTPETTCDKIENLTVLYNNVKFFRYQDTAPGWIEEAYNESRYVWVTSDSISMVYEALSAGCQVGIIPVSWVDKKSKFARSETFIQESKSVVSLESYFKKEAFWDNKNLLNEAERCADEIIRRWG